MPEKGEIFSAANRRMISQENSWKTPMTFLTKKEYNLNTTCSLLASGRLWAALFVYVLSAYFEGSEKHWSERSFSIQGMERV